MRIFGLVGSPRGPKGNTARLLSAVLEAAEAAGARCETAYLSNEEVLACLACDACHRSGACSRTDAFAGLRERILAADALVLGSPNYVFHVSAQMKAFLDRCCGVIHCMAFRGRFGASVVTSGGGGEAPVADYLNRFLMATGIVPVGSVWATMGGSAGAELEPEVRVLAEDLGRSLVEAWRAKRAYPAAEEWIAAFRGRMRALVAARRDEWPFEYEYWRALEETS